MNSCRPGRGVEPPDKPPSNPLRGQVHEPRSVLCRTGGTLRVFVVEGCG